jgi:hypothetical protein
LFFPALSLSLSHQSEGTACARAQFSECSSTTNGHSETGQMGVCCQNLTLGALSSRSALYALVGALFIKFGLFFKMPRTYYIHFLGAFTKVRKVITADP